MFTKGFDKYACEGDTITCEHDGFTLVATIHRDSDAIPETDSAYALDKAIVDAWYQDEWFYCGVAVTAYCDEIKLTGTYEHALWGIECNFPGSDNSYLRDVANDYIPDAIESAKAKIRMLVQKMTID